MPSKIIRRPSIDRRDDGIKADVGETDGKVARADIVEDLGCKRDKNGKADQNDGLSSDDDGVAATVLVGEQRAGKCCDGTYDVGRDACISVLGRCHTLQKFKLTHQLGIGRRKAHTAENGGKEKLHA